MRKRGSTFDYIMLSFASIGLICIAMVGIFLFGVSLASFILLNFGNGIIALALSGFCGYVVYVVTKMVDEVLKEF